MGMKNIPKRNPKEKSVVRPSLRTLSGKSIILPIQPAKKNKTATRKKKTGNKANLAI